MSMMASFSEQAMIFLQSCVLGVLFGINYDFFRVIRHEFRLRFTGIFICDIIFWIISLIEFLVFVLNFSSGEGRLYIILAIILGTIFYFLTLNSIFMFIFGLFFSLLKRVLILPNKIYKKVVKK